MGVLRDDAAGERVVDFGGGFHTLHGTRLNAATQNLANLWQGNVDQLAKFLLYSINDVANKNHRDVKGMMYET